MSQMKPNNESNSYQAEKIGRAMLGLQGMNISLQPPGHVGCQFLTVKQGESNNQSLQFRIL
jgi:hypothetical protein